MKNRKLLGNALLLLTAMIWGTAFAFQRAGMESIEPITFNAARMALAAVAVGLVALLMRKKEARASVMKTADERKRYRKDNITGGLFCGVFLSLGSIFQQMGLVYTTASLLMSMEAVFAVVAGVVLLHERMSVREISGCLIMLAAIVLVQIPMPLKKRTEEN